jgi:hypothetical protein
VAACEELALQGLWEAMLLKQVWWNPLQPTIKSSIGRGKEQTGVTPAVRSAACCQHEPRCEMLRTSTLTPMVPFGRLSAASRKSYLSRSKTVLRGALGALQQG